MNILNNILHLYLHEIVKGERFKAYIFVSDQKFHIALNDEAYCTYEFRCPLSQIRTILVNRDLQAITQVDHRSVFPTPMPVIAFDEPKIEFSNDIPRRFEPGKYGIVLIWIIIDLKIYFFRTCYDHYRHPVRQFTWHVYCLLHRRSNDETSLALQCSI